MTSTKPARRRLFHVMTKPGGAICNLDCAYCYFLAKEMLYPGSRFHMACEQLEAYTKQYIEAQGVPEVTFAWQGGEPTRLGLEFYRIAVELQQKHKRPGMKILNTLQTNGTLLDVSLTAWLGSSAGLCIFEETCGNALALEHNGDVYSCDHYVEPAHLLGNLVELPLIDMVASEKHRGFGEAKRDTLPAYCQTCQVRFVCNGGCPKDRILTTPDGEPGLNYLCEGYKAFFTHIDPYMRFMANELRHQRAPANIMQALREEDGRVNEQLAKVGRNDPCPCGSGKKAKHCHGRRVAPQA